MNVLAPAAVFALCASAAAAIVPAAEASWPGLNGRVSLTQRVPAGAVRANRDIFAYPLGLAVWMSFHDYFFAAPGAQVDRPFVGFDNYKTAFSDPDVRQSFYNVVEFLVINVPLTVVLALLLASALNRGIRGLTFLRVSYYVPYVTASVAQKATEPARRVALTPDFIVKSPPKVVS